MNNKKFIIVIVVLLMSVGSAYAQGSHNLRQMVREWPLTSNAKGVHWVVYKISNPEEDWVDETDVGSDTTIGPTNIRWRVDTGNFLNSWIPGDSCICLGSWDSVYAVDPDNYGSNINHKGSYWLFSDILITTDPQTWSPDDTLRPLPQPIATQVGGPTGDIQISITNPAETRRLDQTAYDVMGYWIWADTTGEGTPDAFIAATVMEVGFFSVNGGAGQTTVCTDPVSNYHDEQTVYWAYKLIARPDTVDDPEEIMGYSTHYFSQNSNPLVIIGIEENTNSKPECMQFEISPNPFTDRTDITFSMGHSAKSTELKIFDVSGQLIRDFPIDLCNHNKSVKSVRWYGTDESGEPLPSGVYFIQAKNGDLNLTKKVILQR